ncbi:MAG TPA: bifunctional diguanylate cyclase/phosphodiesterase [Tepidiformaceae bacterium]|nr:bifunctional diguanylate cyclase/phosphodiesterase [Tepidiformaceae bacterium]
MRISPRVASIVALGGLFLVLGLLTAYATWTNLEGQRQLEDVQRAVRLSNGYRDATDGLSEAEIFMHQALEDGGRDPNEFWLVADKIREALTSVAREGSYEDLRVVLDVQAIANDELRKVELFFSNAALGTKDPSVLPDTSVPVEMKALLRAPAAEREAEAAAAMAEVIRSQREGLAFTLGVFAAGAVLMIACLAVLHRSGRRDVRAQVELRSLREVAQTDALTGLGNQRAFEEALERAARVAAVDMYPLALAIVDVDEFKYVNDTFGHDRGDEALRGLGEILRDSSRSEDLAFRIGGDEFAVIMPRTALKPATRMVDRIRDLIADRLQGVTVSIGVSALDPGETDVRLLREQADSALYDAKARGRNMVLLFDQEHSRIPVFQSAKVDACRALLLRPMLDVVFQPIWALGDGRLLAVEALIRPPAESRLAPLEAFQVAERLGRTHELDDICQRSILARVHDLPEGVDLFVNISPHTLEHSGFSARALAAKVGKAGLAPGRVILEMTERSDVPIDRLVPVVEELRALGFQFALDDVGAGTQGFDVLRRLPVDYVKIARVVVAGASRDRAGRAALMAIIAFATEAGARVVAEGVDQDQMLDLIRGLAATETERPALVVHAVQGYLLGRPEAELPGSGSTSLLRQPAA